MNKMEINWNKIKSVSKVNPGFLWVIPLFIIVSIINGIETGLYFSGIMISGLSIGAIIPVAIGAVFKKYDLKSIYGEIMIFVICTFLLCIYIPDKELLAFIVPLSIPLIIIGLLNLRK